MKITKAFQLHTVDIEDYWVKGFTFKINDCNSSYKNSFDQIRGILLSSDFEGLLVKKFCLIDDLFNDDETYRLIDVTWVYNAVFIFRNSDDDEVEFSLSADYVTLIEDGE